MAPGQGMPADFVSSSILRITGGFLGSQGFQRFVNWSNIDGDMRVKSVCDNRSLVSEESGRARSKDLS